MIEGLFILLVIAAILIICFCFKLIGWLLKLVLFFIIGLPLLLFGVLLCCTVVLIPVGMACFKLIGRILSPVKPQAL
ncbi:MAG: hypothetical protein FWE14_09270 [Lachnospiraceae bacterium]|nr:hypothetical protein [Lachnospiraceae bacterium]